MVILNSPEVSFLLAAICGLIIRLTLTFSNQRWINTYHYTLSFILLPVITFTITKIISDNIALALGMVGALSIVRFRNPVKNPFELVLYFLLITIGISMSVNTITGLGITVFSCIIIYVFYFIDKYFKNFFSLSFTEGKSQHVIEITSTKEIPEIEKSNLLIQKIFNKNNDNQNEIFYRVSSPDKEEINNIRKSKYLSDNQNIKNITLNYFY